MAISCQLASGITKDLSCGYVLQSVKLIYLANTADVESDANGEVTLKSEGKWHLFEPAKNTASFTDVLNTTDSGNKYRTHTLSFSVAGSYTDEVQSIMDTLSLGSFLGIAVFSDNTGVLLGTKNSGLEATVVTNTGAASATEASGISVEMSSDLTSSAYHIEDVKAFIGENA